MGSRYQYNRLRKPENMTEWQEKRWAWHCEAMILDETAEAGPCPLCGELWGVHSDERCRDGHELRHPDLTEPLSQEVVLKRVTWLLTRENEEGSDDRSATG